LMRRDAAQRKEDARKKCQYAPGLCKSRPEGKRSVMRKNPGGGLSGGKVSGKRERGKKRQDTKKKKMNGVLNHFVPAHRTDVHC